MNLVNERYKIIRTIDENSFISSFKAKDLDSKDREVKLTILNSEYIDEEIISLYRTDFVNFASVKNQNILKNLDFGIVNTIDENKISEKRYFYTSEYVSETDFFNFMESSTTIEIIDVFIQICKAVNYLNNRGIYYDQINLDNIIVTAEKGYHKAYLRDMASVRLNSYLNSKDDSALYIYPELMDSDNEQTEIYSLGTFLEDMVKYKKKHDLEIDGRIYRLIDKLKSNSISSMYSNLREFIQDLNESFNLDYELFDIEDFYELDCETKVIGRHYEIRNVLDNYERIVSGQRSTTMINVVGGSGTGKTKFLNEIFKQLTFEKANLYTNIPSGENELFIGILKNMVSGKSSGNKECEIEIEEYVRGQRYTKTDLKALEKIGSCMLKGIESETSVFILDDIDKSDEFSIELLKYIFHQNKKKILIIGSSETEMNRIILSEMQTMYMKNLTLKESNMFIEELLQSRISMGNFSTIIYKETYGNPKQIKDIIQTLKDRNLIYMDERNGTWETDFDQEYLFSIENIDENIISTMEKLDGRSKELMSILSLFNSPVTYEVIEKMTGRYEDDIFNILKSLTSMGFIQKKVEDSGYVYDISSKSLRSQIYSSMDELWKRKRHRRAAILLEEEYKQNKRPLEEELIYHFEKAELKNKLLEYAVISGEKFMALNLREDAIEMFEKAYEIIKNKKFFNKKIHIIKKLGFLYLMEANIMKSIYFYEEAYELAIKENDQNLVIDFLNKIVSLYMVEDRYEYVQIYLGMLEEFIKKTDYKKGYINFSCNKARYSIMKKDYESALKDIEQIMPYINLAAPRERGYAYDLLGKIYMEISDIEKALMYKYNAKTYYLEGNNMWGYADVLSDIGYIYSEFNQEYEKALEYYKASISVSEKYDAKYARIKSYYSIGKFHISNMEYDMALSNLQKALQMAKKSKMEKYVFGCYVSISKIYFDKNMYEMGTKYYELSREERQKSAKENIENGEFYLLSATMDLIRGDLEEADSNIEKALDFFRPYDFKRKWNAKIIRKYIDLYRMDNEDESEQVPVLLGEIESLIDNFKNPLEKIDLYYHLITTSLSMGQHDTGLENLNKFIEISKDTKNLHIAGKKAYLIGISKSGVEKEKHLKEAIAISNQLENDRSYWYANSLLGDYYLENGKVFQSLNYYLEGALIISEIIDCIREGYLENFVDIKNMKETLCKLKRLKEMGSEMIPSEMDIDAEDIEKMDIFDYDKIVDRQFIQNLLKSKNLLEDMEDSVKSRYEINEKWDIAKNLHYDSMKNIEMMLEYLIEESFGTRGMILINDENSNLVPISTIGGDMEISYEKQRIIDKSKRINKPVLINILDSNDDFRKKRLPHGVRAIICVPIQLRSEKVENEKRKSLGESYKNVGFIYMEASKILNNFNTSIIKEIQSINNILGILIQNYNYKTYSFLDKLTGAYNRKYMEERVLPKISSMDEESAIVIMDLDNFKKINDTYGHQIGDEVLHKFAEIVRENIRQGDVLCRYGGEEFLLFIPKTSKKIALDVAERIRKSIQNNLVHPLIEGNVTASMGVSVYPYDGIKHNKLINKADKSLYIAKKGGRNKVIVWDDAFECEQIQRKSDFLIEDSREINKKLLSIATILESIKYEKKLSDRVFLFLKEIMEQLNAEDGYIVYLDENSSPSRIYKRDSKLDMNYEDVDEKDCDRRFIDRVINSRKGFYQIDWDNIISRDSYTGMPNWNSVISEPIIASGDIVGIIHFSSDRRKKEFDANDLKFLSITSSLIGNILKSQ